MEREDVCGGWMLAVLTVMVVAVVGDERVVSVVEC